MSGGTRTPLILQQSGVGDASQLKNLGIPTISDLPNVGLNLANHLIVSCLFSKPTTDVPSPDLNALYSSGAFLPDPVTLNLRAPRASEWIVLDLGDALSVNILETQPYSRGSALIQSKDPLTAPLATEAALDDPRDLQTFIDIIVNQLVPIANNLNSIDNNYVLQQPDPSQIYPNVAKTDSDAYLTNYIQNNIDHAHHWQSQTIMASRENGGVVDTNGKVYGTKNLYVADNCIVPFTVDGNTAGIAYVIGFTIGKKLLRNHG